MYRILLESEIGDILYGLKEVWNGLKKVKNTDLGNFIQETNWQL